MINYIEKHRLNDRSKRFIPNKENKSSFKKDNKSFKNRKDFKGKKLNNL